MYSILYMYLVFKLPDVVISNKPMNCRFDGLRTAGEAVLRLLLVASQCSEPIYIGAKRLEQWVLTLDRYKCLEIHHDFIFLSRS